MERVCLRSNLIIPWSRRLDLHQLITGPNASGSDTYAFVSAFLLYHVIINLELDFYDYYNLTDVVCNQCEEHITPVIR